MYYYYYVSINPFRCRVPLLQESLSAYTSEVRSQVAEWLGKRASNQKFAGSIPGCEKLCSVLGQGTSPYLPQENVPVLTVSRSGEERLLND